MGSEECFSNLVGPASGSERRTKCGLQAVHGGFSKGSPVITFDARPGPAAKQATLPDSTIPLGPAGFKMEDGLLARWGYEVPPVSSRRSHPRGPRRPLAARQAPVLHPVRLVGVLAATAPEVLDVA